MASILLTRASRLARIRSSSCSRSCLRRFSSSSRAFCKLLVGLVEVLARLGPLVLVEVAGCVLFVGDGLADVFGTRGLRAWRRRAGRAGSTGCRRLRLPLGEPSLGEPWLLLLAC